METVLIKYSDFFEDDGGFEKIRKDFDKLGDDLEKRAKDIREKIKLFDVENIDAIKQVEAETEALTKTFKKYGDAKADVAKIEQAYLEQKKKEVETMDDQVDKLIELDKQLGKHQDELKEVTTLSKLGIKTDRDFNKERVNAQLNIKKVTKQIQEQQKEILKSNELSAKEQKLLKAKITLEIQEVKTLDDVRDRLSALRTVVQSLDLVEQAEEIKKYNDEINDLTDVLSENSDKFIQSKINIGNYEESIVKALKGTKLFHGELDILNNVFEMAIGFFQKSEKATQKDTISKEANTKATKGLTGAVRILNTTAKATGILLLLTLLASLAGALTQGRSGTILTEKALKSFNVVLGAVKDSVVEFGKGLLGVLEGLATFSKKKSLQGLATMAVSFTTLGQKIDDVKKGIDEATTAIERGFEIADKIKRANLELEKLNKLLAIAQIRSDDSTLSLNKQLQATSTALDLQLRIQREKIKISEQELEIENEKIRANLLQNRLTLQGLGVNVDRLRAIKDEKQFAEEILKLSQQIAVKSNPIDTDAFEEQQAKLLELTKTINELDIIQTENAKKRREINRDIFEQNLDLLIDLIDTEKNLSEQYVNDVTKNFQKRLNEFNRFLIVFRQNSQKELDEFTKEATNMGLKLNYRIAYDENGDFKIFINDTELATDNIVKLNKQLQATGMNEIDINRFREFMVETRNGVKDFRILAKEITLAGIALKQMNANLGITKKELTSYDLLSGKIEDLARLANDPNLGKKERTALIKELEELEEQRAKLEANGATARTLARIEAIDAELKLVEVGSSREAELLEEKLGLQKQMQSEYVDEVLESTKKANQKALDDYKKFADEVQQILQSILDKVLEVNQKRVESAQKSVDKQEEITDIQRRRAEEGLTNTLAFEQRELGKREADLIKRQKRQERLEKVKALYSSYNNYASKGDTNPIAKALRDFAILEAITASFGEGGIVEDKLPSNGIFKGQSHRGNQGGIPIKVEGREGIFSVKEMENIGKDNFYKMKDLAGMGKMDSNFFSRQREAFVMPVPVKSGDKRLLEEMKEVKKAIESKPVQQTDVIGIVDGVMEIVETVTVKNKTTRNSYKTKKPRL